MIDDKTKLKMIDTMIMNYYECFGPCEASREAGMLDQLISDITTVIRFGDEEQK